MKWANEVGKMILSLRGVSNPNYLGFYVFLVGAGGPPASHCDLGVGVASACHISGLSNTKTMCIIVQWVKVY